MGRKLQPLQRLAKDILLESFRKKVLCPSEVASHLTVKLKVELLFTSRSMKRHLQVSVWDAMGCM